MSLPRQLPPRRRSRAALWAWRLALFALLVFTLSLYGHRSARIDALSFLSVLFVTGVLSATAFLLSLRGLRRLWTEGEKGGLRSLAALAVSCLLLVPYAFAIWGVATMPAMNDISTDLEDPPVFAQAARIRTPAMSQFATFDEDYAARQLAAFPDVTGRRYEGAADRVHAAVIQLIDDRGWTVTSRTGRPGEDTELSVEAEMTTPFFAFPNDVVVRISEEETTTYVDMRSAARYGVYDFGANANLIVAFLRDLDLMLSAGG